jgi:hypothetical protein
MLTSIPPCQSSRCQHEFRSRKSSEALLLVPYAHFRTGEKGDLCNPEAARIQVFTLNGEVVLSSLPKRRGRNGFRRIGMFSAEDSSCADINKTRVSGRSKRICSRNLRCSPGVTKWRRFEVACTGNRIWERRPGIHHPRRRRAGSYRFWGRAISSAPQARCWEGRVHSGMDGERDSIVPRRHVGVVASIVRSRFRFSVIGFIVRSALSPSSRRYQSPWLR